MRLIDSDAFLKEARDKIDMQDVYPPILIKELVLDEMPTVEAERIIRCKDCKYFERYSKDHPAGWCHAAQHGYMSSTWDISIQRCTQENEFCSQAERRKKNAKAG